MKTKRFQTSFSPDDLKLIENSKRYPIKKNKNSKLNKKLPRIIHGVHSIEVKDLETGEILKLPFKK